MIWGPGRHTRSRDRERRPGAPKAAVARLRAALAAVLALPDTRKRLADQGINPGTLTTDQFAKFIRSQRDKFAKVVKDAGIPLQ